MKNCQAVESYHWNTNRKWHLFHLLRLCLLLLPLDILNNWNCSHTHVSAFVLSSQAHHSHAHHVAVRFWDITKPFPFWFFYNYFTCRPTCIWLHILNIIGYIFTRANKSCRGKWNTHVTFRTLSHIILTVPKMIIRRCYVYIWKFVYWTLSNSFSNTSQDYWRLLFSIIIKCYFSSLNL
jgi:hypothetical protein